MSQLQFESLKHVDAIGQIFATVIATLAQQLYTGQILPNISAQQAQAIEHVLMKLQKVLETKCLRTIDFNHFSPSAQTTISRMYSNRAIEITPSAVEEFSRTSDPNQLSPQFPQSNFSMAPVNHDLYHDVLQLRKDVADRERALEEKMAVVRELLGENYDLQLSEQLLRLQICEKPAFEDLQLVQRVENGNETHNAQQPMQPQHDLFGLVVNPNQQDFYPYQQSNPVMNSQDKQMQLVKPKTLYFGLKRKRGRVFAPLQVPTIITRHKQAASIPTKPQQKATVGKNGKAVNRIQALRLKVLAVRRNMFFLAYKTGFVTHKVQLNATAIGNITKTMRHLNPNSQQPTGHINHTSGNNQQQYGFF